MVFLLGKSSIFLPPLMVARNVLVSNLVSFLDAATSVILWFHTRVTNAQKATSYDEENKCARRARTASSLQAKAGIPPAESNDFTLWCRKSTARHISHVAMTPSTHTLGVGVSAPSFSVQGTVR